MNKASLNWPGYYDVVILPPAPVRDHAIELSRHLQRSGGMWSLSRRHFFPHISLYHIPVSDKHLGPFLDTLQEIADSTTWGDLEITGFDMPVLMVNKPEWLSALQRRIVLRTVRFFNWDYGVDRLWSLQRFSGRRLEFASKYLREYGTPMTGMNFRPHLTLSSFKGSEPTDLKLPFRRMRFRVNRIQVCELGTSHSCQKLIWGKSPR